jgi:PEP-CTERM motif
MHNHLAVLYKSRSLLSISMLAIASVACIGGAHAGVTLSGTGTIPGDVVLAGGTVAPGNSGAPGVLTITGNFTDTLPGELDIVLATPPSELAVDGKASLLGNLTVSLAEGFSLTSGETFDVVEAGDGVTDGLTSFSFDGAACEAVGGAFKCTGGDIFSWSVVPGTTVAGMNPEDLVLSVTVPQVPEPSTWAMMLAGFAGVGFLSRRASRKAAAAT